MRNAKSTLAMKQAWSMARDGQRIFGGKVRQFLAEALRIAWAEVKANPITKAVDDLIADLRAQRAQAVKPTGPTRYLSRISPARSTGHWPRNAGR